MEREKCDKGEPRGATNYRTDNTAATEILTYTGMPHRCAKNNPKDVGTRGIDSHTGCSVLEKENLARLSFALHLSWVKSSSICSQILDAPVKQNIAITVAPAGASDCQCGICAYVGERCQGEVVEHHRSIGKADGTDVAVEHREDAGHRDSLLDYDAAVKRE